MRYIPVNCLRQGMICGQAVKGRTGQLLLNRGTMLHDQIILRIRDIGMSGIYIDDELTADIEVKDIISDALRTKSVHAIKKLATDIGHDRPKSSTAGQVSQIGRIIDDMLDMILVNNDVQVNMLDLKIFDDYTYYHSVNVSVLSLLIGASLDLSRDRLHVLGLAAMLHDIGKVFIDKDILNKPGKLTDEEFTVMKGHSLSGYQYLLSHYRLPSEATTGILDHHERIDGSGYPNRRLDGGISLYGKIIAVADVFDALTSDRPYRKALPMAEGIEFIMGGMGTAFSGDIVRAFLKRIVPYGPGTTVRLSNGALAVVVKNFPEACLRPMVRVIWDKRPLEQPRMIDLFHDPAALSLTITSSADPVV